MQVYGIAPGNNIYFDIGKVGIENENPACKLNVIGDINYIGNLTSILILLPDICINNLLFENTNNNGSIYKLLNKII
jgi:hypothetical protein